MMDPQFARLMSAYNRTVNERLYAACAKLTDDERRRDRQAFFRSIHGTLNHLLLTDRLWFGSFIGQPVAFDSLDEELYTDFDELRRERGLMDANICEWAARLTVTDLNEPLKSGSTVMGSPLWVFVAHFFNHQAHHRGQVSALLSQAGIDYGVTDLPWLPGVVEALQA
jgi:uncharacterized damage-inducible protein DinB